MPNYSLLINSQFKPYSFEELIKPYQIYGEAYKEMEGAYNTLGTTAGALESVLNDERDPIASGMYKNYMQGLNNAADELATKGLSPSARTNINNLTKQYATSIVPIQKAAETWQKQIEEQRKNGDSKINSYNASTLSIDKFLENPQLSYDTIDKGNLMKTSTAYFSQMAKQARDIQAKKLYDKSGKYTYERDFVEEYGATPEEVIAFQNDMERALQTGDANAVQYVIALHPELGNIADKVFKSTKAVNWDPNSEGVAETWNTIIGSSIAAMGETKHNLRQDAVAVHNANAATDYNYWKKKQDYVAEQKAKEEATKKAIEKEGFYADTTDILFDFNNTKKNKFVKNGYIVVDSGGKTYMSDKYKKDLTELKNLIEKYDLSNDFISYLNGNKKFKDLSREDKNVYDKLLNSSNTYTKSDWKKIKNLTETITDFGNYIEEITGIPVNAEPVTYTKKSNNPMWPFDVTTTDWNIDKLDEINNALNSKIRNETVSQKSYRYRTKDFEKIGDALLADMPKDGDLKKVVVSSNNDGTMSLKEKGGVSRGSITASKQKGELNFGTYIIVDTKEGTEIVVTDQNGDYYRVPESATKKRVVAQYDNKVKPYKKAAKEIIDWFENNGISKDYLDYYSNHMEDTPEQFKRAVLQYKNLNNKITEAEIDLNKTGFPDLYRKHTSTDIKD